DNGLARGARRGRKTPLPSHGPVSLSQFVMKATGKVHERTLVLFLMGVEAVFGATAILLYVVPR
ncbi:MAG: hypothetical protein NT125_08750, partial [Candidatus Bipolaricaulota bacterium]|nr:hypothetical protein [Candidatus Bipolaricaulota bacterium]